MNYMNKFFVAATLVFTALMSAPAKEKHDHHDETANADVSQLPDTGPAVWSYDMASGTHTGPEMWSTLGYPECGGDSQSPINIDTLKTREYQYSDPIVFEHYDKVAKTITVKNNGYTLVATFGYEPAPWRPSVSGGQLSGSYEFQELHFHWGTNDQQKEIQRGSEHTIDGLRAPLEMHMVHRNTKYKTMSEALNETDGILMLATLFEMNTNNAMRLLLSVESVKEKVVTVNGSATLRPRRLAAVLPEDTADFFHYHGSMTEPGCQESVEWIIFERRSRVLLSQLKMLEELKNHNDTYILQNFRPIQKLNNRKIDHVVFKKPGPVFKKASAACSLQTISIIYVFPLLFAVLFRLIL